MRRVRTRFAPSPTGFLHVGSLRTAAFAWLLARHYGGDFVLRIEDTDRERRVEHAVQGVIEELLHYGLAPDEGPSPEDLRLAGEWWEGAPQFGGDYGPYIQTLRQERYEQIAEELVERGVAYRCDLTPEQLEKERADQIARGEAPGYSGYSRDRNVPADTEHVIRFRMPDHLDLSMNDAVRGVIAWDQVPLKDPVLLKRDRLPTYNLAVVVDDHDMEISHVMRGDEFLGTAPLHLLIYRALGWDPPIFAHLPVINGSDGKKLGKRHGATTLEALRAEGYLDQALLNFILLIGWSPGEGDDREVLELNEIVELFTLEGISRSSGVFDYEKLRWMNGVYIRNLADSEFTTKCSAWLSKMGVASTDERWIRLAPHIKERVRVFSEVEEHFSYVAAEPPNWDLDALENPKKKIDRAKAKEILEALCSALAEWEDGSAESIESILNDVATRLELKPRLLFPVARVAVTGGRTALPLFEVFSALGPKEVRARVGKVLDLL